MKKIIVMAMMAALLVSTSASAFEVVIPYFQDGHATGYEDAAGVTYDGSGFPIQGTATPGVGGLAQVMVANLTADDLVLGVVYTDASGLPSTPDGNTFIISANSSMIFRPVAEENGGEQTVAQAWWWV